MKFFKKIKNSIEFLQNKVERGVDWLYYSMPAAMRVIVVLLMCVSMGIASMIITINAIYRMGKNDAKKELFEMEHIKNLPLKNDTVSNRTYQKLEELWK